MSKPKLLDLFCGAGGAAAGYQQAGFYVVGIDINPQPHYCGDEFYQDNALTFPLDGFNAYHASPPCQFASTIAKMNATLRPGKYSYPNLISPIRERLITTGKPYVIENVPPAREFLTDYVQLCGSWFGLNLHRHRLFECNFPVLGTPCSHYWQKRRFKSLDKRNKNLATVVSVHGNLNYTGELSLRQYAMGIDWMTNKEITQAIPPDYTEYIGKYLLKAIDGVLLWLL